MHSTRGKLAALVVCLVSAAAIAASSHDHAPRTETVTNVKVLPPDLSTAGIRRLMDRYEDELGVSCGYCHVEDRETNAIDYASDDNPRKHTARLMISMLDDINGKYLAQLGGDRRYAVPVTCGSCHQGRATPPEFASRK